MAFCSHWISWARFVWQLKPCNFIYITMGTKFRCAAYSRWYSSCMQSDFRHCTNYRDPEFRLANRMFQVNWQFFGWILVPKTIVYFVSDLFCSKESKIDCISNCLWWGRVFQEMTKTSLWNEHRPNLRFRFRFSMPINLTNNFYFDQIFWIGA